MAAPYEGQMGYIPKPEDVTAQSLSERQDANISTAIRIISNSISWLPFYAYAREIIDGSIEDTVEIDHPANELINEPNPFLSGPELKSFTSASLKLAGNAFIRIEILGQGKLELWPIPPWRVDIDYDKVNGIPAGFILDHFATNEQKIPTEEMIHIRDYNINNPFYGMSGIKPIERLILMDYYAEIFNKIFFKNGCTMSGIYAPDFELQEEQLKALSKSYNAKHQGAENAFKMFFPQIAGKFYQTSVPLKDLAFGEMFRMNREKQFSVMGIPPSVGGVYEYANYANADIQERTFWRHTMIPHANIIADGFTRQLLWRHFDRDHVFKFDTTNVEALQPDKLIEAQRLQTLCGRILTPNECRDQIGYDPVEGGDELNAGFPDMFADPAAAQNQGDGKVAGGNTLLRKTSTPSPREKAWKAFDNFLTGKERGYQKIVRGYFRNQYDRVMAKLNQITGNGYLLGSGLLKITKAMQKDKPIPGSPDNIFDGESENEKLIEEFLPYIKQAMKDSGNRFFAEYGLDLTFNINDPNVITELERMINRSKIINDTTYDALKNLLAEAYDNGWSMGEVEKGIKDVYKYAGDIRARTIARTEMLRAVNGGTLAGYDQGGVQKKEWLASMDANTRDTHAALNGEIVRVGEPFTRGSVPMDFPGDPTAPAEEVINCRCAILPIFETE